MDDYFIDDNTHNTVEIEDVSENIKMKSNKKNRSRVAINDELEIVQTGFANAVAEGFPLSENEKLDMINSAEHAFGMFLDALKCDWRNDPNSMDTPRRVAKAYVNDLWAGRYTAMSEITSFPSDGYDGIIIERDIPLTSMCSHHHQVIGGLVHIGYIAGEGGQVIGLSKLNRIVELFGRRGAIQEQLTTAIHNAVDKVCEDNKGVIVTIVANHNCVSCRGVKHQGASMVTTKASGAFRDNNNLARKEFFDSVNIR
jgi:GTP cyclohydrolase I|tara:strand:+ start:208 stop:972 length:765 start_codon:yes stop_codon:yes gene_type:complete